MKYCVYGLGAVGGLLGGRLAAAGFQVSAVALGETLHAVQSNGLKLICDGKEDTVAINVSDDPAALGPQDVVIISVKNTAIGAVAANLAPLLHPGTTIISAMNGVPWWFYHGLEGVKIDKPIESVDPDGSITRHIDPSRVVGCVANLSASTPAPGVVQHKPNPKFTLGEPTGGSTSERCAVVLDAMRKAGLDAHGADSIQREIWFKLWGNMTLNPISAMTGATSDNVVADPLVRGFMARCMEEARRVGSKIGIELDATPESRFDATRKLGKFKTSMLQDAEAQKPLELDALVAAVREIATDVGIETPNIDALFGLARLYARRHSLYPEAKD
ncbi:2-dehydropantoate 2-reductase [Cupriavidus taiwanensis]|uniref:2-dehydropantoate 2-reductase n=1 Tax=Cupriavidus taiwanensis TaxID=164546 RepID=A0A7Z7JFE8_9BURK|nr:2-dehydropantoate 2-reductase [Cupriavidus taiwanensis]SOZ17199.1 putative 2-dehydropantoate 2-reductase [Cupriavidus taiwanensis]SOZ96474.1 putative 2-dehydropantoate 2-reductase [Cupriavidus taiwanensis]SPC25582.1 putative 2-dehydropantoate 2-reductase [Cupriavidus taiwanensis]